MADFIPVSKVNDIREGVARSFSVGGRTVAVARAGGEWYAFDDTCTHAECSLAEGDVEEDSIVCPCHFGAFDMGTGDVLAGPPKVPVDVFDIRIEDDELLVSREPRRRRGAA
jgi:nitrite reductase (NADH) small subunit